MAFTCENDDGNACQELSAILLMETTRSTETEQLLAEMTKADGEPTPSTTAAEAITGAMIELGDYGKTGDNPYDAIADFEKQAALGWCILANEIGVMCPVCPLRQHLPSEPEDTV